MAFMPRILPSPTGKVTPGSRGPFGCFRRKDVASGDIFPGALWQSIPRSAGTPPRNATTLPPNRKDNRNEQDKPSARSGVVDADTCCPAVIDDSFIKSRIFTIRGVQVVLDRDLAELYGVATKALNQAVRRNPNRFPEEFMFALSKDETEELVTNCHRFLNMRHSSVPSYAFSEHGVIMVASVLKSEIAARISVRIAKAFVSMRRALASIAPMLTRLDAVERRQIADQARNEERFAK